MRKELKVLAGDPASQLLNDTGFYNDSGAEDKIKDACGVFGIYGPGEDVARLTFFGLYALQHRGQESAGITVSNGRELLTHKDMGLVSQVFTEERISPLKGDIAIGHTRYSTTGGSYVRNAQPFVVESNLGTIALAHNGNIVNTNELKSQLSAFDAVTFNSSCDSELIALYLANHPAPTLEERLTAFMQIAKGAYSLVILTNDTVYGVRDPWGIRPLCLGKIDSGWVIASESCALQTIGATFLYEMEPGEILRINHQGIHSTYGRRGEKRSLCLFEYIYFARPDTNLAGHSLQVARVNMGRELARQYPAEADLVIGVPDTGVPGAIGYAAESGISYGEGLVKNRYIGRTFIQPEQRMRQAGIRIKFNPLPDNIFGKRIVVVDDSIVRGNTTRVLVDILRKAGATEVHMRITAPPIMHPCYFGVDMATREELIGANMSVEEIRAYIGSDSLGYLSLDRLVRSTRRPMNDFCTGCLTGRYPISTEHVDKFALERETEQKALAVIR